jgi:hypothetical protein
LVYGAKLEVLRNASSRQGIARLKVILSRMRRLVHESVSSNTALLALLIQRERVRSFVPVDLK